MTNKDKYLKEGVKPEEFVNEIIKIQNEWKMKDITLENEIREWLKQPVTPTLTEDERVILRNIDTNYYPTIKKCAKLYI